MLKSVFKLSKKWVERKFSTIQRRNALRPKLVFSYLYIV